MDQSGAPPAVSISCDINTGKNQTDCTNCLKCLQIYFNTYHAAGMSRRQVKKIIKMFKNVKLFECHDHWNPHKTCIQLKYKYASYWFIHSWYWRWNFRYLSDLNTLLSKTNARLLRVKTYYHAAGECSAQDRSTLSTKNYQTISKCR